MKRKKLYKIKKNTKAKRRRENETKEEGKLMKRQKKNRKEENRTICKGKMRKTYPQMEKERKDRRKEKGQEEENE